LGLVLTRLVGSREETLAQAIVAGQRVESVWDTIEALLSAYGDGVDGQLAEFRRWRRSATATGGDATRPSRAPGR
jgi:hypothetical protein